MMPRAHFIHPDWAALVVLWAMVPVRIGVITGLFGFWCSLLPFYSTEDRQQAKGVENHQICFIDLHYVIKPGYSQAGRKSNKL